MWERVFALSHNFDPGMRRSFDFSSKRLIAVALMALTLAAAPVSAQPGPVRSVLERRQENVVLQKYDLSCGAAALATLLTFQQGDPVSEREVALGLIRREEYLAHPELVRVQQGFSLLDMKRFVEHRGYRGEGFGNLSYADLLERSPAIVSLRLHGYNHFVIFRGAMGETVLLSDPAYGNRTMSRERFMEAWREMPDLGRVAFVVTRRDGLIPPNRLAVSARDFAVLH